MMFRLLIILLIEIIAAQNFEQNNVKTSNSLDTFDETELTIENVYNPSISYNRFKYHSDIKYLRIVNTSLEEITPGSFDYLPKLRIINLNFNNLQRLQRYVFNNLPISRLYIIGNKIQFIHTDAFDNMTYLEVLDLSHNLISEIRTGMFLNSNNIRKLIFNNNNISLIPMRFFAYPFRNAQRLDKSIIDLSYNKLKYVDPLAFEKVEYVETLLLNNNMLGCLDEITFQHIKHANLIDLSGNNFTYLPYSILSSWEKFDDVDISYNDFNCSFISKYKQWTIDNNKTNMLNEIDEQNCFLLATTTEIIENNTQAIISLI